MPKVSVIIPAYNCEPYIAHAVQSVFDQDHRELEIIVVDDGSSDNTVGALASYQDRIQLIQQKNAGAAAARNAGLRAAQGELLAFLDADDWWETSRLSTQLAALKLFPSAAMVFSDFAVADQTGAILMPRGIRWKYGSVHDASAAPWQKIFTESMPMQPHTNERAEQNINAYHGHILRWLFRGNFINTCSVLLRREVFERIGEFDQSLQTEEDYEYWLRIARDSSIIYIDTPLVTFRKRPGQLTRSNQIERIVQNVLTVIERTSKRVPTQLDPQEILSRVVQLHMRLGVIALCSGHAAEARSHLRKCLHHRPTRAMTSVFYVLTFLPVRMFAMAMWVREKFK